MERLTSYKQTGERYLTLRVVGATCTEVGAVLLLLGAALLAFGLYALLAGSTGQPPGAGGPFAARPVQAVPIPVVLGGAISILWSLGLLVSGLQFLAVGAFLRLAIHVEENTRATAQCLEALRSRLEPREEVAGPFFRS